MGILRLLDAGLKLRYTVFEIGERDIVIQEAGGCSIIDTLENRRVRLIVEIASARSVDQGYLLVVQPSNMNVSKVRSCSHWTIS